MRVRTVILPSALLVALLFAVGCKKNGNGDGPDPNKVETLSRDDPNANVGPLLFSSSGEIPKFIPTADRSAESLVIPNATVQYEERQQVAAEVDAKVDLVAFRPKLLPKVEYLVERQANGSLLVYDRQKSYPGVEFVEKQGVVYRKMHGDEVALQPWQPSGTKDGLIYDWTPEGALVVLELELFHKGTYVFERRADGSVMPYVAGVTKFTPQKTPDGGELVLAVDQVGVPHWDQYVMVEKQGGGRERRLVSHTPLPRWAGNSIIAERRPDGSVTFGLPPHEFSYLVLHPRDLLLEPQLQERILYRKLNDGDPVERDDVICWLDDQMVSARMVSALKTKAAALEVQRSARGGTELTQEKLDISVKLWKGGTGSYDTVLSDRVTLTRFEENLANATQTIAKAESDYTEAEVLVRKHRVTSSVTGVARNVVKRAGEFVKAGDKIMDIQSTEKLRLEGNLDIQYADRVYRGMTVQIEPALPSSPVRSHAWHRAEVTGLAVTPHPGRPLVISTSADGAAVWDPNLSGEKNRPLNAHHLPHEVAVRSVAVGPYKQGRGSGSVLAVTGADDGKVRVWELGDPAKLPSAPKFTSNEADTHTSAVVAVAFSPDGEFFASAAGREVFIWNAAEGKKRYTLPAEHRDTVTSLQFTPQSHLVTVSKDRTVKLWKLGADKAAVLKTIDHRSGAVDVLGVSQDGGRVLFDQDKTRIDVISLHDRQTVGQIQTSGSTAAFGTVALFSPRYPRQPAKDDPDQSTYSEFLATAGGEGELKGGLQVWTVPPSGGRGSEIGRLFTPNRVGVTCAAFSPATDTKLLAAGTTLGTVHVWVRPSAPQKKYVGTVRNVDATDPRYVTVRVEMDNRELRLYDRSAATIIIPGR
jgi:WD40 repeat protein